MCSWIRKGCRVATVRWPIEPPLGRAPLAAAAAAAAGGGALGGDDASNQAGPRTGPVTASRLRPCNDGARDGFWLYFDA